MYVFVELGDIHFCIDSVAYWFICFWKSNKKIIKPYSFTISQMLRWNGNIYRSPIRLVPVVIVQLLYR